MTESHGFGGNLIYTRIAYDALGRKTLETNPSFYSSSDTGVRYTAYDALGRLLRKETDQADGFVMETQYSHSGHSTAIEVRDQGESLSMSRSYGSDGKLIRTQDALNGVTRYAYDSAGNPITLMDANNNPIYAQYNGFGHKVWVDDPNMGLKTFAYNSYGEVERETDARGISLKHELRRARPP